MDTAHKHTEEEAGTNIGACPVCGGHTKLENSNIYCPTCKIIVSDKLADSMKAKVAFIKESFNEKKLAGQKSRIASQRVIKIVLSAVLLMGLLVWAYLFSLSGFYVISGMRLEREGNYSQAAIVYEQSLWPITLPGAHEAVARNKSLVASQENFNLGLEAFKNNDFIKAAILFGLVHGLDTNYTRAQELRRESELKLVR